MSARVELTRAPMPSRGVLIQSASSVGGVTLGSGHHLELVVFSRPKSGSKRPNFRLTGLKPV